MFHKKITSIMFKTLILIIHHFVLAVMLYYDNIPLHIVCIVF